MIHLAKGWAYCTLTPQKLNTQSWTEAELATVDNAVMPQVIRTHNFLKVQGYGVTDKM
jgi:hypothetical protein